MAATESPAYKTNVIPFRRPLLANTRSASSYFTGSAPNRSAHIIYLMSESDRTLRLMAFAFNVLTTLAVAWLIVPLLWMVKMDMMSWEIYKGTRPNTVAFGVVSLFALSPIGGVLLLCSKKDR